jgi:hypothetical protein
MGEINSKTRNMQHNIRKWNECRKIVSCWESLWKFINLLTIPSSLWRSYSTFPLCSWTTLINWNSCIQNICIQLFQLRLSPEQSWKVEYERERLLGIANKFIHLWGTTLIEIAVSLRLREFTVNSKLYTCGL